MRHNLSDSLDRNVYCLLGVPVDAIGIPQALADIGTAMADRRRCFLSTVNLNFIALSRRYPEFRQSLLESDLCTADGVGVMALARLFGVPLHERVSGADMLDRLAEGDLLPQRPRLFLFGGQEGAAEAAAGALNQSVGVTCCGFRFPGFGSLEEMSDEATISAINDANPDFLVVSLGARKGQAWIMANRNRLTAPVVSHLGAAINFAAGTVARAPRAVQRLGLEWLWRIKAEPYLWSRYAGDAALVGAAVSERFTMALKDHRALKHANAGGTMVVALTRKEGETRVTISGACLAPRVEEAKTVFRETLHVAGPVCLDLSGVVAIDARFIGLLLVYRKQLEASHRLLRVSSGSSKVQNQFRLHGAEYLLA